MNYIGSMVKSVAGLYNNLNSATLTGAIDIVVVERDDGTFMGSPFHVRFGKLGVVSSREKVVEIQVNGKEIPLQMKLGPAGEAFFVEEARGREKIPPKLGTSPIPPLPLEDLDSENAPPPDPLEDEPPLTPLTPPAKEDAHSALSLQLSGNEGSEPKSNEDDNDDDIGEEPQPYSHANVPEIELTPTKSQSIPIPGSKIQRSPSYDNMTSDDDLEVNLSHLELSRQPYCLSDMDSPISSPLSSSPISESYYRNIHSDTEAEKEAKSTHHIVEDTKIKWEWGELPEGLPREQQHRHRRKSKGHGIGRGKDSHHRGGGRGGGSSGGSAGASSGKFEAPAEGLLLDEVLAADKEVADMYLNRTNSIDDLGELTPCGEKEDSPVFTALNATTDPQSGEIDPSASLSTTTTTNASGTTDQSTSPVQTAANDANQFDDWEPRDVAFSLCGGLKDRKVRPDLFLENLVSYEAFCGNPAILHDSQLVIRINDRYYNWAVAAPYIMSYAVYQQGLKQDSLKGLIRQYMPKKRRGWSTWWRGTPAEEVESSDDEGKHERRKTGGSTSSQHRPPHYNDNLSDEFDSDGATHPDDPLHLAETGGCAFKKVLRLTSDQWKSLNLQKGSNTVTFTVTTRLQGTAICEARIFLWDSCDKLVISDIDGTITKSDVLGHIMPIMGRDWSQQGVTGLFHKIKHNGYRFVYLSARAIGQAQITRDFLKGVKQGELSLPDGPVLLSPTSLFKAFKKEVIERKPEEFKISCLRDVKGLFSDETNPFYSGFGNRVNDVWAYREVGIPISRVFTINYKGEIKHELTNTFSSSYSKLIELVDQMFPPISARRVDNSESEFTSFSYWRTPIVELPTLCETPETKIL